MPVRIAPTVSAPAMGSPPLRPGIHPSGFADQFPPRALRLISFNIQAGIQTQHYRHYVTRGWQHLLPGRRRQANLRQIAELLQRFDLVALQEVDGGSLRSGFVNQMAFLAEQAQFPFWYQQCNRDLGRLGQHGNGLLARYRPWRLQDLKLPGLIPGRGAIVASFGSRRDPLVVAVLHLALGQRSRQNQLAYLAEQLLEHRHLVVMGDMNAPVASLLAHPAWQRSGLVSAIDGQHTYPSWQPHRSLDHILVSPSLQIEHARVLEPLVSDHLPLQVEIGLPEAIVNKP